MSLIDRVCINGAARDGGRKRQLSGVELKDETADTATLTAASGKKFLLE